MLVKLRELRDIEGRLRDAIGELRAQQALVAEIEYLRDSSVTPVLLSAALRQFGWLEDQQNGLQESIGEELPLKRGL